LDKNENIERKINLSHSTCHNEDNSTHKARATSWSRHARRQPLVTADEMAFSTCSFALTLHVTLFADENIGFLCLLFSYENFLCVIQVDIEGKKLTVCN